MIDASHIKAHCIAANVEKNKGYTRQIDKTKVGFKWQVYKGYCQGKISLSRAGRFHSLIG